MKLNWIKYDDSNQPPSGTRVLVYFTKATQSCDRLDVKYFTPKEPGYCWGWYPGSSNPEGTYWMRLDDVPGPITVDAEVQT